MVERVLRGDTHSFGIIIKNTEGLVAAIVLKMIPNAEDRKDIAQDIFMKTFHKLSGFKSQSKLSTWIGRISYNTCLSWLEKKKLVFPGDPENKDDHPETTLETLWHASAGVSPGEAEQPVISKELSGILQGEIDRLPPVFRTLISLFHQEELSYEEMAQITGLPEGTVKSYLFRARKKLKENLLSKYKKEAL